MQRHLVLTAAVLTLAASVPRDAAALDPEGRAAGDFHYEVGTRIPLGRSR